MSSADKLYYQYAIVRVDYDRAKSRKQQRIDAVDMLSKKAKGLYGDRYNFEYTNVLVLWNNLPREDYLKDCLGYSEQELIRKFCIMLKKKHRYRLYIDSPNTLTSTTDISQALRNLLMIWKESGIIPIFLENNFLENEYMELQTQARIEEINKQQEIELEKARNNEKVNTGLFMINTETSTIEKIRDENVEYFTRFFSSLDRMTSIISGGNNISKANNEDNFIKLYFDWQMDKVSVEDCLVKLGDISRASWYRYVNSFEKSPIYEEYTIANNLIRYKKKGSLPDVFEFLKQFKADNKSNQSLTNLYSTKVNVWDCYLKFDEIESLHDVRRVYLACLYRIEIMKHKGIFNKRLAELGLEEKDIMIEFNEKF